MSTCSKASCRQSAVRPDSSASISKSNANPFQVTIVNPDFATATKYSTRLAASCSCIFEVGAETPCPPCQSFGASSSVEKVAAHEIPSGRKDFQLKSSPGTGRGLNVESEELARHGDFGGILGFNSMFSIGKSRRS
jgi:hypothetical protein